MSQQEQGVAQNEFASNDTHVVLTAKERRRLALEEVKKDFNLSQINRLLILSSFVLI